MADAASTDEARTEVELWPSDVRRLRLLAKANRQAAIVNTRHDEESAKKAFSIATYLDDLAGRLAVLVGPTDGVKIAAPVFASESDEETPTG